MEYVVNDVIKFVITKDIITVRDIMIEFKFGINLASKVIDDLEKMQIISEYKKGIGRKVLLYNYTDNL